MLTIPPYLKKGDTVGITCPASKINAAAAEYAAGVIEEWGFKISTGATVGTSYHNFAATDEERLQDLQLMLDDENIRAVLFGRGGYGIIRILDKLDFSGFIRRPKWLCGYSDITALHIHLHKQYHIASMHSVMCSGITAGTKDDVFVGSLREAWSGTKYHYPFSPHPLNRNGRCQGALIGGNLSLLTNLSGTVSQPDTRGKILFIEDTGEYRYHIDRMLYNLKRAGWLDGLAGLIAGSFTDSKETNTPFGQTTCEIILDKVKEYGYPVAFGFPAGHQPENYTLKMGVVHTLDIATRTCELTDES
jgi:muramoyltetrapeptide carboxypeptidase